MLNSRSLSVEEYPVALARATVARTLLDQLPVAIWANGAVSFQNPEGLVLVFGPDLLDLIVYVFVNPLLYALVVEGVLARRDRNLLIVLEVVRANRARLVE